MKRFTNSEHFVPLAVILVFSLFALIDLLKPGIPLTHDGKDHVARIANFYMSLSEGVMVPRWAANLNWGYGHPVLMFLYPLPSYLASFFHTLGFDLSNSLKIVFATTFFASGVGMYFWLRTFLGKFPSILGGVLYLFLPYRFIDLYVRGAIGEHVAFVFPPLVLLFSSIEFNNKILKYALLAFSVAGLLLSHNAVSIMFLPIFLGWFVLQYFMNKKIVPLFAKCLSVLIGFGLSAFFLIPAFMEGKYTLRDIVTGGGEYSERFISAASLLYGHWSYGITGEFSTQLGIVGIVWCLVGTFFLFRKKNSNRKALFFWYSVLSISLFLMLEISKPVYELITTLQKFQFPWRFLSVSIFAISVIAALSLSYFKTYQQRVLLMFSLFLIALFSYQQVRAKDYFIKSDSFYKNIYHGTTDTGESAPIWSVRFMEREADTPIEIIEGQGEVKNISRTSTRHAFDVTASGEARILDNTLYFPNWEIYINGSKVPIEYQDPNHRGLMTFKVASGENRVTAEFNDTKVRTYANAISMLSVGFILLLIPVVRFIPKKYKSLL